jgi:hypothetical protein
MDAVEDFFGKSANVLIENGEFNDVEGEFRHYNYSQHITNNNSNNIIDTKIHNVSNSFHQDICMFPRLSSGFRIGLLTTHF